MAKVSIVVPIYNVEEYLERCVDSILAQTIDDIEIILVDDGSLDNCPQICDRYVQRDKRIKVIHKENGGLSSARNAGMDEATGEYIGFVDADDTIEPEMYERLADIMQEYHVDFVMSDMTRVLSNGQSTIESQKISEGLYKKEDIIREVYPSLIMGEELDYGPFLSVCPCLYDLSFLRKNQIRFDEEVRWSEDNIFSAICGRTADSFYYVKWKGYYHYYQNSGSITTSYRDGAWETYCTMNDHLNAFFDQDSLYDFARQLKLHMIYYACVCLNQTRSLSKDKQEQEIRRILMSSHLKRAFLDLGHLNVNYKLRVQLFLIKHRLQRLLVLFVNRNR